MRKYLIIISISCVFWACKISNSALNDNSKPLKTNKIVATNPTFNILRTKFLNFGDSIRLYSYFVAETPLTSAEFVGRYQLTVSNIFENNGKEKLESRAVAINEENVIINNRQVSFYVDMDKPKGDVITYKARLILMEKTSNINLTTELEVRPTSIRTADIFQVFKGNIPAIDHFVTSTDTLQAKSLQNTNTSLYVARYKHDFDVALSPLYVGQRAAPKPLYVDSLFQVNTNQNFVLAPGYLYYFIKDTTDRSGFCLISSGSRFPKYTRAEELIKPLVYISTNQEFTQLKQSAELKKSLDQFWLNIHSNNQITARKSIKLLYDRVAEANLLFTNFKEGWKTDKGLVYVVMGKPDAIRFVKEKEVWMYNKLERYSEVNFTFNKKPNIFTEYNYDLNRFADFAEIWKNSVYKLRTGSSIQ